MADIFKKAMLKSIGPGGWTCPCCNMFVGREKKKLRRQARARLKNHDQNKIKQET